MKLGYTQKKKWLWNGWLKWDLKPPFSEQIPEHNTFPSKIARTYMDLSLFPVKSTTLPKTNMEPENVQKEEMKRKYIYKPSIWGFHVSFQGCSPVCRHLGSRSLKPSISNLHLAPCKATIMKDCDVDAVVLAVGPASRRVDRDVFRDYDDGIYSIYIINHLSTRTVSNYIYISINTQFDLNLIYTVPFLIRIFCPARQRS